MVSKDKVYSPGERIESVMPEQMPVRILKDIRYKKNVWGDLLKVSERNDLQYFWNGEWTTVPVVLADQPMAAEEVDAKDITI